MITRFPTDKGVGTLFAQAYCRMYRVSCKARTYPKQGACAFYLVLFFVILIIKRYYKM